jgi:hypothetical protein
VTIGWRLLYAAALIGLGVAVARVARPAAGQGSALSSCVSIHYVFNPAHSPPDALADVQSAFAQVSTASGLTFTYDGLTTEAPSAQRLSASVLIAWTDPAVFGGIDDPSSVAGLTHTDRTTTVAGTRLLSGWVYLSDAQSRSSGFSDRRSWGGVLMHEFGHLAGLAHSTDPAQMMYPRFLAGPAQWGTQDLAELRRVGERAGCHR